ncbi:unnamed protein product [Prunus brigantina]
MKKAAELVFIPSPGAGHLVSAVEIAKLLVARDDQLFITVLIMKLVFIPSPVKDAITKLTESDQSDSKPRLAGFVIDLFCTSMIDVADEFGVPTYIFFTSSVGFLGLMFHLQTLHDEQNKDCIEFNDSDAELVVPSFVNPLPAESVLPGMFLDQHGAPEFINHARRFRETKGILVNTFMQLESHALHSISDDGKTPTLYPVAPILNLKSDDNHEGSEILKWLDDQPPSLLWEHGKLW